MRSYRIVGRTGRGPVREANQDHILMGRFVKNSGRLGMYLDHDDDYLADYGLLFAVSDGVGGEAGGGAASNLTLMVLEKHFYSLNKRDKKPEDYVEVIEAAATRANNTVLQVAANDPGMRDMGATLTGICLMGSGYLVFNAGDSRVYRCRNATLKQLTRDDSVTARAVREGVMSFEEAESSTARHTLTNCMGSTSFTIDIQTGPELRDDDLILICSDGLHDMLSYEEMEAIFQSTSDIDMLIGALFEAAVENGGYDNISVILLHTDIHESDDREISNDESSIETTASDRDME